MILSFILVLVKHDDLNRNVIYSFPVNKVLCNLGLLRSPHILLINVFMVCRVFFHEFECGVLFKFYL